MEIKAVPTFTKDVSDRTATGIFAVHGHLDSYNDISYPGSFSKTLAEQSIRLKYLWQHNFDAPPIAVVKSVREVSREELPNEVLQRAPDATGGVEVVREYLDTPRGNEVLAGIKAGAITEQSYGYDAVKFDFTEAPNGMQVRNLREVRLYEVSDVQWGANDATLAAKAALPIEFLLHQLSMHLKAGARHSAKDTELLNAIHQAAVDLGATSCKAIAPDSPAEATDKSRADLWSLTLQRMRLDLLDLEAFTGART